MRGGRIYLNGVPVLNDSPHFDRLSRLPSAPLADLIKASSGQLTVHSWARGQIPGLSAAAGFHAYIADCETDEDLAQLARFSISHATELLLVGASGLGAAVANQLFTKIERVPVKREPTSQRRTTLFVIGSRSPTSASQIDFLRRSGAAEIVIPFPFDERMMSYPEIDVSDGIPSILLIRPDALLKSESKAAKGIATALGRTTARVIHDLSPDAIVMSGGDTAQSVFDALRVTEAVLLGEIMPGIPIGTIRLGEVPVTFVTKSGSFGDQDALAKIERSLDPIQRPESISFG
jgi:uncharacterized protein YgbK (DUF1537 family)